MSLGTKANPVKDLLKKTLWPAFNAERQRLDRIDKWYRWDHDKPHAPRHATQEYKTLEERAQTPWLTLVVTSVAQAMYVDGHKSEGQPENTESWRWWQANGLDGRQIAVHRAALAYGLCYATVLPGRSDFTGKIPVIRGVSPRRMISFYAEPENDDWPMYALKAEPVKINGVDGWKIKLYDDQVVYQFHADASGTDFTYITFEEHGLGVCPVVRYTNQMDLEGRTPGEVEPFIPIAGRIDQTTFDRLVVQRFASWVVRTIAGMSRPDEEAEAAAQSLLLKVSDLLVAEDSDTKFGSLPATPLDGFIQAAEADIRTLAAVSQTPAHELLGQMANLSAEALAAARASLTAKVDERKKTFGESHEQVFRLAGHVMGNAEAANDFGAQVKWADTEIRSLAQAADALGKLATMLGVPVEVLWDKIPGFTQQDVEEAKGIVERGDSLVQLKTLLDRQAQDEPV
jgi:hypothetical protein